MKKLETINELKKENAELKEKLESLLTIVRDNEAKHKGFRLIEEVCLSAESLEDIDEKALKYMEDIFGISKATLFIDERLMFEDKMMKKEYKNIIFVPERILRYAYVDKRPYYGKYLEGLISEFRIVRNIGSYLIIPILDRGKIIASLNLYSPDQERIAEDAKYDFAMELSFRLSITLRKLSDIYQMTDLLRHDPLTGLHNRTFLNEILPYLIKKASNGAEFCFLLMAFDNFKYVNDNKGFLTGDEFLKAFAKGVSATVKAKELLGRFCGSAFYLILFGSEISIIERYDEILKLMDRMEKKYTLEGQVALNCGYACVPKDIDPLEGTATDVVKLADLGLYLSKVTGKKMCSYRVEQSKGEGV